MMMITNAAGEVIREWLRASSSLPRPVVYLGQTSNSPPEVTEAVKRGLRGKELEQIARRALMSEPKYLYPLVYPSSRFMWLTTTIDGFRFASLLFYPRAVRDAMKSGSLDAAGRSLILRDAHGAVVLPTDAGLH
jgi:hypothetical protein